jgi:excisionase family DNA binding protein
MTRPARATRVVPALPAPREASVEALLTIEEAAALLAVPVSWLKQRVSARSVTCTRLGRHVRFTREQVAAIIDASEQPSLSTPLTGLTRRSRRPA